MKKKLTILMVLFCFASSHLYSMNWGQCKMVATQAMVSASNSIYMMALHTLANQGDRDAIQELQNIYNKKTIPELFCELGGISASELASNIIRDYRLSDKAQAALSAAVKVFSQ